MSFLLQPVSKLCWFLIQGRKQACSKRGPLITAVIGMISNMTYQHDNTVRIIPEAVPIVVLHLDVQWPPIPMLVADRVC